MFMMTKDELSLVQKKGFKDLIKFAGGVSHLAKMLGISAQVVQHWAKADRISRAGVKLVIDHPTLGEKFGYAELRPELAPEETC